MLFIVAAAYTGILVKLNDRAELQSGYFYWIAALVLMFLAPVISRLERKHAVLTARRKSSIRNKLLGRTTVTL